ncbi:Extra-large guanine nucleotide-binding protein 1 [Linum perenne]
MYFQAKILYQPTPFTKDELENIKFTIQSNVYGYLGILLEGRDLFEEESSAEARSKDQLSNETDPTGNDSSNSFKTVYSIGPRLKSFSDWLLKTMVLGNLDAIFPAATPEYAPLVEELWKDPAMTYNRKNELEMLPSVASYFLERAVEILSPDYEPSDLDILGVTSSNGVASRHTAISLTMMNNMITFLGEVEGKRCSGGGVDGSDRGSAHGNPGDNDIKRTGGKESEASERGVLVGF